MPFDPEKNKIINLGTITAEPETRADEVGFSKGKDRDQEDWFKFTLKDDGNFSLSLDQLQQNADVILYDGDRDTIIETSKNRNQQPERINTFLEEGTYFLNVVPKGSDRTDYLLSLNALFGDDPDGNRERATKLKLSQEQEKVEDKIGFVVDGTRDQNDYYQFTLTEPRDVNINLDGLNQNANLALLDSTGSLLFSSTESGQQLDSIDVILEPETYYIKVSPFADNRTEYNLSATALPFGEPDDELPGKDLGTISKKLKTVPSEIGFSSGSTVDSSDYYKFSIEEESKLNLTLEPTTANADLELYGIDANNDIVSIFSSDKDGTKPDELSPILDPGDYFALVKRAGTNQTKYELSLSANPDIADADGDIPGTPLAEFAIDPTRPRDAEDPTTKKNFRQRGTIGRGTDDNRDLNDYYQFTLLEKGDVRLQLDGLTANANLELLDSAGAVRDSGTKGGDNAEDVRKILSPGTYYIRVFPNNNTVRTKYELSFGVTPTEDDYPSPGQAKELDILEQQDRIIESGQIGFTEGSKRDSNDFYKFSIAEPSGFNLKLDGLSANANVFLFDSELKEKAKGVKGDIKADTIAETLEPGDYFVRVEPPGRGGTKYRLELEAIAVSELDPDRSPQTPQVIGDLDLLPEPFRTRRERIGFTQLGIKDEADWYRFQVTQKSDFSFKLDRINGRVTAKLFSGDGEGNLSGEPIVDESTTKPRSFDETLNPGTYYLQIEGNKTNYDLTMNASLFEPQLLFEDLVRTEGNLNELGKQIIQPIDYLVSLSEPSTETVTVDYALVDRNAMVGEDYNIAAPTGTLTFVPGDTQETIPLQVLGDVKPEKDEEILIQFSKPTNAKFKERLKRAKIEITNDDLPQISISDASINEVDNGTRNAVFEVTLDSPSEERVTVKYATENGTASAGSDYTTNRGRVIFNKGETAKGIKVTIKGDRLVEADETLLVNLENAAKATIADAQATGTIVDNDLPNLLIEDVSLPEGNLDPATGQPTVTNFEFPVTLSDATSKTVTVNYTLEDRNATLAEDYNAAASGTVTFAPKQVNQTIVVPVLGDIVPEVDETFVVKLSDPVNGKFKNRNDKRATGTIINDELPQISIGNASIDEGNSGTKILVFPVTMNRASDTKVTLKYVTADGTAKVREDYQPTTGTLIIGPGKTTGQIKVPIAGNKRIEEDETFFVDLKSSENATILDAQAIGTIVDNDFPLLSVGDVEVVERASGVPIAANFPVTLNRLGVKTLTVDYATTADGNATAGTDYTATNGQLSFAPGETEKIIRVQVLGDSDIESDERFFLDVSNIVNGEFAEKSRDRPGMATIIDDDKPTLTISDGVNIEGDSNLKVVVFDVSLETPSNRDVTVRFSTENGTAVAGGDYNATSQILTIPKRQTTASIKIPIVSDQKSEPDETFTVKLTAPQNAVFSEGKTELQATGIILDNDDPLTGDRKVAGGTTEADTFELGTAEKVLYAEKGNDDYLVIANFAPTQDTIQLHGSATDYQLIPTQVGLITGTAIYRTEGGQELIGIVKDSASLSLDSGFSFV